jgi:hypothetical protein
VADQKFKSKVRLEAGVVLPTETISKAMYIDANGELKSSAVSDEELDYLSGVTSSVQDQITAAQDSATQAIDDAALVATSLSDMNEPTGFLNRADSQISFVDGTRTFTIQPAVTSFDFYVKSAKYTVSAAQTLVIPNTSGNHYIYYNQSGVLESTTVFSSAIIEQFAFVAIVYWNTSTSSHTYFADERHGITMDGVTHAYLHTVFGARYLSGLALLGFSVDGTGDVNSNAQFTADSGSIRDEDILHQSLAQAQIPVLYRDGLLWKKKAADAYPVIYSGSAGYTGASGRLPFNEFTGGAWQLTEVPSLDFVLVHIFATNDIDNPIVAVQGTASYPTASAARTNANLEISTLSGMPFAEFVPMGSVIFQTATGYTNATKSRVRSTDTGAEYVDFRGTQLYTPAGEASSHGLLSGLSADDHLQYHTDARGDIRYYTKSQVDSTVSGLQSDINSRIPNSQKGAVNGVATLNASGKLTTAQIPAITITDTFVVASEVAMLALVVETGDVAVRTDLSKSFILKGTDPTLLSEWQELLTPTSAVVSVNGQTSVVVLDSDDISQGITNLYFSDELAQDAVGTILVDSSSIDFSYLDGTPSISATVLPAGVDHDSLLNYAANDHVDHSTVSISTAANSGLAGGGDITATRSLSVDITGTTALAATPDNADELLVWDVSTSARKKVTVAELLAGVAVGSAGDIEETSFAVANSQAVAANVTGLAFSNSVVRSFKALVSVQIDATLDLWETVELIGINKAGVFDMAQSGIGDDTGVVLTITSGGQIQYTSATYSGFVSGAIKFRAITTSV